MKSLHRACLRRKCAAAVITGLTVASLPAQAQNTGDLNAQVISWVRANQPDYNKYIEYARHAAKPQVPIPPQVDPPCHVCGDKTETTGEKQVQAWLKQSEEPESSYIRGLMAMSKQLAAHRAEANRLSPAAVHALYDFEDEQGFLADAGRLADRLLTGKAFPMAEQYDKDPTRAYAGIEFLRAAGKQASLLQGRSGEVAADDGLAYARTWAQSIVNKIDTDIVAGHKYNLCPVYAAMYRQVATLGGSADVSENFQQILQKLQKLMTFDLNMSLKVHMPSNDGGHLDASWTGKATLHFTIDVKNSCYTPHWENGGQMAVNVTDWDMVNFADGKTVHTYLTSAHQYDATLREAQVSLCDPQPIFQLPLANIRIPQEQVTIDGHAANSMLLGAFLDAVVGANELNNKATNAVTGGAPSVPGAAPASSASHDPFSLDEAKAEIEEHKSDVNWLMSPQGRAAMAKMQKLALAQAQSKMAVAGLVVPRSNSFSQLSATMSSVHLHWTNGKVEPVDQTLHVTKDGNSFVLNVTVQQAAQ
jgi:hypothetical protein